MDAASACRAVYTNWKERMRRILASLVILAAVPALASAQLRSPETRGFVAAYAGMQTAEGSSAINGGFSVYGESTGKYSAEQSYEGGGLFSFGGGLRVWKNLAIGVAYTRWTDTQVATASVSAPHPILFDTLRTASASVDDLGHEEDAIHLQALLILPFNDRVELTVGGGPTLFGVKHDFVTSVGFTEGAAPYSSIALSSPKLVNGDENTTGFNLSGELAVYVSKNVGAAAFYRYSKGTATFDVGGSSVDLDAGGSQFGGGLRLRF